MRKGDWIQTYTGQRFYCLGPRPEEVKLVDIAHALSHLTRFTGHSEMFYSVGHHSLLVWQEVANAGYDLKTQLYAVLHDASEAYLNDVARPVKKFLGDYLKVEEKVQSTVWTAFGLPEPTDEEWEVVKWADNLLLINEIDQLMHLPREEWSVPDVQPFYKVPIKEVSMKEVKERFIWVVHQLIREYHFKNPEAERNIALH